MPPTRRSRRVSSKRAVRTSMRVGNWASLARASRVARPRRSTRGYQMQRLSSQIRRINTMIETKSGVWTSASNVALPHNNVHIVTAPGNGQPGERLNILQTGRGVADAMGSGAIQNRIGDKITVKGVMIKAMFENALNRAKVHYRLMVVKCGKGDVPDRASLFQNNSNNKLIDQVNVERYTIIAQKQFNITPSNVPPSSANAVDGAPEELEIGGLYNAGQASRLVTMWIPGRKFGRGGNIIYQGAPGEGVAGAVTVKFFDYYILLVCYDWFGTPQDVNNVGRINSLYTKIYFQDA